MNWLTYIANARRRRQQQPVALLALCVWSPNNRRAVWFTAPWAI